MASPAEGCDTSNREQAASSHLSALRRFAGSIVELQHLAPTDPLGRLAEFVVREMPSQRATVIVRESGKDSIVHHAVRKNPPPRCPSCPDCRPPCRPSMITQHQCEDGCTVVVKACAQPCGPEVEAVNRELAEAVARVVAARLRWERHHRRLPAPLCILSDTQWRICAEMLSSMPEKQIAGTLGMSPHTLHTHLKTIYRRLRVRSRSELVELLRTARHELFRNTLLEGPPPQPKPHAAPAPLAPAPLSLASPVG